MIKTIRTLLRGAAATAEETLADQHAIPILDQQIRDVAATLEAGRRALALAMGQHDTEARRLATIDATLEDLETRAVQALKAGREDLAWDAAIAILPLAADRDAALATQATLAAEVEAMRRTHADATQRLTTLRRGRTLAEATEAVHRLRAGRLRNNPGPAASLTEAEATLSRLRHRQSGDAAAETALDRLDAATVETTAAAVTARLGDAGFGARTALGVDDVMARLKARAA